MRCLVLVLGVLLASPVYGLEYPCPSDPGFCYLDVANDGCFDAGTDVGPIDGSLEAGTFNSPDPMPGSIVCPPSVDDLRISLDELTKWETAPGGDVLLYRTHLSMAAPGFRLVIAAGGDVLVGGRVDVELSASGQNVIVDADVRERSRFTADGDVEVSPGVSLNSGKGGSFVFDVLGEVRFGTGVRIRTGVFQVLAGDVIADSLNVVSGVRMTGRHFISTGYTKMKSKGELTFALNGDLSFERVLLKNVAPTVDVASFSIGDPNGKISKVITGKNGYLIMESTGDVTLDLVDLRLGELGDQASEITAANITHRSGRLRGRPGTAVTFSSPGTCDLTGTKVVKVALSTACGGVVGP